MSSVHRLIQMLLNFTRFTMRMNLSFTRFTMRMRLNFTVLLRRLFTLFTPPLLRPFYFYVEFYRLFPLDFSSMSLGTLDIEPKTGRGHRRFNAIVHKRLLNGLKRGRHYGFGLPIQTLAVIWRSGLI